MDFIGEFIYQIGRAALLLIVNPFYWISIALVGFQYRRAVTTERKLFSSRLHSAGKETISAFAFGLAGGLAASIPMAVIGTWITARGMVVLLVLSFLLALLRIRFMCMAYAVGLLGIVQFLLQWLPNTGISGVQIWIDSARQVHVPSLLVAAGLLHGVEAWLVSKRGEASGLPVFVEGKRGKIVGGYQFQGFWPVPLLLWLPAHAGGSVAAWSPLLGGNLWQSGWHLFALPVVLGFTDMTISRLPADKIKQTARRLWIYAAALLVLAAGAELKPILTVAASVIAIIWHEAMLAASRFHESERTPMYVEDARGLVILAVLPGSPADDMGIRPGEIISKVNGVQVRTKEELHRALQINSAHAKLEVLNHDGHSKFAQRAMFSNEHHQLGIVLSPDKDAYYFTERRQTGLMGFVRSRLSRRPADVANPSAASDQSG